MDSNRKNYLVPYYDGNNKEFNYRSYQVNIGVVKDLIGFDDVTYLISIDNHDNINDIHIMSYDNKFAYEETILLTEENTISIANYNYICSGKIDNLIKWDNISKSKRIFALFGDNDNNSNEIKHYLIYYNDTFINFESQITIPYLEKVNYGIKLGFIDIVNNQSIIYYLELIDDNINVNNVNPFEKARVTRIAANADATIAKAESNLQDFNRARELLDTVPTGGISGYARSKMSPSLLSGDTAEFQSLVDKITPQMRPAGSGSTSDKDMEIFRNATIGLNKPKQTNLNIVKGRIAVEENNIAKEEIRAEMLNSGMSTSNIDKKWRQYLNDNPIFKNSKGDLNPNRVDAYSYFQGSSSQDEDNSIENLKNKYNLR